ncbi:MAG: FHA domain-containing protein [Myxococcales bacterium]|nr:FHA domain-containing protein [Myxococcales bacterium]MCB9530719.1 FHA domain-containing protein [Myxococcales bacterium]MCB9533387.1 FHA domain-containing protein [Myxococcales bacterium]
MTDIVFGSDTEVCDLWVERKTVSAVHARITVADDGFVLVDEGSTNGTYVRGQRVPPHTPVSVAVGDRISLGRSSTFVLADEHLRKLTHPDEPHQRRPLDVEVAPEPRTLSGPITQEGRAAQARPTLPVAAISPPRTTVPVAGAGPGRPTLPVPAAVLIAAADGQRTLQMAAVEVDSALRSAAAGGTPAAPPAGSSAISLGYAESNDVVLPYPHVSGRHARIYRVGDRYLLEDQGSTNGTWVDDRRIERAWLQPGARFALGATVVTFDAELVARLARSATDVSTRPVLPFSPGRVIVAGRAADCDLRADAATVSGHHAAFTVLADGTGYSVRDLGSTNGTYLNARENRVDAPVTVGADDIVFLGTYRLPVARVAALVAESAGADQVAPSAAGKRYVVGRSSDADVVVDAPVISARHAEVTVLGGGRYRVRDLGSSNGTFVDGVQLRGAIEVGEDARVSLGSVEVLLDSTTGVARRRYRGDIMLQAERLTVEVPVRGGRQTLLDDVSFTAYPTEFVGLMGPSGAGKTTLMLALAGFAPPTAGRSLLNGLDLYERYNAFRGSIGYVPQDDIVFPQLTVYESLYYTARLRLPPDTTRAEIDQKIDAVLQTLEIAHTRDTRIGDALQKGISGGERKRVNLAQELITEPSLLCLDEPTSGLASEDTLNVMRLLRALADEGRTILLTIHQPSLDAYRLMDNVLYLVRGTAVYYGPAFPDSILFMNGGADELGPERDKLLADPGNALKPLARDQREAMATASDGATAAVAVRAAARVRRDRFETSRYHREYVEERRDEQAGVDFARAGVQRVVRRGALRQWWVLTQRTALIKWKDRVNSAILLAQAPVIGAVLAWVFGADHAGGSYFDSLRRGPAALFLLVASAVWFGCSNAAREIVGELAVYRRERMVNLMIPAYAASKFTVLGAICALQCAILLGICYAPLGLQGSVVALYGALLVSALVGLGSGLTLSALVRSQEAAMALVPLTLIPQIVLGGVIMPLHEMGRSTETLASLTATRWGYEAALFAEFGDDTPARLQQECEIADCVWGAGATGATFTYYPGDPSEATESETVGGVEAVVGGVVPYSAPADTPLCFGFCAALQRSEELGPLDAAFGPDPADPLRRRAVEAIAGDGHAPDEVLVAPPSRRVGYGAALGALALMLVLYAALVGSLLRSRDVAVG